VLILLVADSCLVAFGTHKATEAQLKRRVADLDYQTLAGGSVAVPVAERTCVYVGGAGLYDLHCLTSVTSVGDVSFGQFFFAGVFVKLKKIIFFSGDLMKI